jgi:hypothetical protein
MEKPMATRHGNHEGTQLFLLRLWREEDPQATGAKDGPDRETAPRWHGKVQQVVHGEAHAFTSWEMMIACIEAMLLRDVTESAAVKPGDMQAQQLTQRARGQRHR